MSYISELELSVDEAEEIQIKAQGFTKIEVNLNQNGRPAFLWCKKGNGPAITRIQFAFNNEMSKGLIEAGYQQIVKNLSQGAGGDAVYLWYYKGSSKYDVPIVDLSAEAGASLTAENFKFNWQLVVCVPTNNPAGNSICLWLKREKPTYISDVAVTANFDEDTDLFLQGYSRIDEVILGLFFWYRMTPDVQEAIRELQCSTNQSEYDKLRSQSYRAVNQDLKKGTKGNQLCLWYKKDDGSKKPIKAVNVISNRALVQPYKSAGFQLIDKNLNAGNDSAPVHVCFYQ